MANEFKVKNGLLVTQGSSNITVAAVDGTLGRLFQVDDTMTGSLFSINTVANLPIIEAFSDNTVRIGQYARKVFFVSQSAVGIGKETLLNGNLDVSGSIIVTGSINVSGSVINTLTSSYAVTASYTYNALSNLYNSNGTIDSNRTVTIPSYYLLFTASYQGTFISSSYRLYQNFYGSVAGEIGFGVQQSSSIALDIQTFNNRKGSLTNAMDGGIQEMKGIYIAHHITSSNFMYSNFNNLDSIYIERGTFYSTTLTGSIYASRGIVVRNLQGTSQSAFVSDNLNGAHNTNILLGTYNIPSGSYSIYSSTPNPAYFSGSITIQDVLILPPVNPLPSGKATGSLAVSGSGANCKIYFFNGAWQALF